MLQRAIVKLKPGLVERGRKPAVVCVFLVFLSLVALTDLKELLNFTCFVVTEEKLDHMVKNKNPDTNYPGCHERPHVLPTDGNQLAT